METSQITKVRGRSRLKSKVDLSEKKVAKNAFSKKTFLKKNFSWSAFLFTSAGLISLISIMSHFSPTALENFLLPNSYLPVLILIFFTSFFALKIFFDNQNLAWMLAWEIMLMLFLKLQILEFNFYWLLILLIAPLSYLFFQKAKRKLL